MIKNKLPKDAEIKKITSDVYLKEDDTLVAAVTLTVLQDIGKVSAANPLSEDKSIENSERISAKFEFETIDEMMAVFGSLDEYIKLIEKKTNTQISAKDEFATIYGAKEDADAAVQVLKSACALFRNGEYIDENRISYLIDSAIEGNAEEATKGMGDIVAITHKGKPVKCRTLGQKNYMKAIDKIL